MLKPLIYRNTPVDKVRDRKSQKQRLSATEN
jgi:hypothetical protein